MILLYTCVGFATFWTGLIIFFYIAFKFLWIYRLGYALGFGASWKKHDDDWAIVTGSTDGIGLEYARQMAKLKYNLLLISRNLEKLESVKKQLLNEFPECGEIRVLAYDFNCTTNYKLIENEINKLSRIDVLINNVGISYNHPEFFTQVEWETHESIININIFSCAKMMHMVLPRMETQRRGIIINLSSYSGIFPVPLLGSYSATKAYVDFLSQTTATEYKKKGIIIQSVGPIFVATKMSKIKKPSLRFPTAESVVISALRGVGLSTRSCGFWYHGFQVLATQLLVLVLGENKLNDIIFKQMSGLRDKYYNSLEKRKAA